MNPIIWFFSLNPKLGPVQRRRSNMLRILMIILLVTLPLFEIAVLTLSLIPAFDFVMPGLIVGLLLAQYLNRTSLVRTGAWLAIVLMIAAVLYYLALPGVVVADPLTTAVFVAPLVLVPVLASGAILGAYAPLIVGVLSAIGLVITTILTINVPAFDIMRSLSVIIFLIFLVGLISSFTERYVSGLFDQLMLRNQELEQSNAELAVKRDLEQHIGDRINVLAAQVSSASAQQSRGANDQLSGIVEATTTLEELNQTNKQIARAAQQVAGSAQEALQVAEHGGETIKGSVQAMTLLQERVSNIAISMDDLFRQSQEIDQIIELISGVADETNLLALNATIEAAGAREYGRRFAAVANEVQRLAGRTSEAAESVRLVISEVQDAIKKAAGVTKEGLEDATRLSVSANEVGQTIEGMVQMVQNTAMLAQQITFSIQQQESAGTQIVDTMRQISNLSRQMTENSRELLHSIFELNQTADRLRELENAPPEDTDAGADYSSSTFTVIGASSADGQATDELNSLAIR